MTSADRLPPDVRAALNAGNKLEAIKLLRKATGLSLKDAMEAIVLNAAPPSAAPSGPAQPGLSAGVTQLPTEVIQALRRGDKIDAIRILRAKTGSGLKEAHDAIEAHLRTHSERAGLSPGEVAQPTGGLWILAAAVIAAVGAWLYW